VVLKLDTLATLFLGTNCVTQWVGPSQSEHFGEEKNLLPHPGLEPWIIQPVV